MASKSSCTMNILQWNCHSIIPKFDRLKALLTNHNIDIFCLNETWLVESKFFRIPNFKIIRKDRATAYGGVLIGIHDNIEFNYLDLSLHSHIEYVAVSIKKDDFSFCVICIYIPPNTSFSLTQIKEILSNIPTPFYILGDLNAHNVAWGSERTDGRGTLIMDLIDDLNLNILNDGSFTRVAVPPFHHSCIDLSLCSNFLSMISSWKTIDDPNGSDHLPILIESKIPVNDKIEYDKLIPDVCKNVNWSKFSDLISMSSIEFDHMISPIENYNNFSKLINECLNNSQNRKVTSGILRRNRPSFWWDKECSTALKNKSDAFKKFRKLGTRNSYFLYSKAEALFTRITKFKKRNYWKHFVENLDKDSSLSTLWSTARNLRNYSSSPVVLEYSEDWIDKFASKICPDFAPQCINFKNKSSNYFPDLCIPFTISELNLALSITKNTAPGIDNIKFIVLKNLPDEGKTFLLSIYNSFIKRNIIPFEWRFIKVVSILKPGKDPSFVDSRRPISLLSCLRKLMERMILNRLELWAESNNVFPSSQYGFRRGRGTRDCVALLASQIQLAFNKKQNVISTFLDVSGAYDSVLIDLLYNKMNSLNIPSMISNFLCNLFSFKIMHFFHNGSAKLIRYSYFGLPQGSCLSPFLYNLFTSDMYCIIPNGCFFLQFADDNVISISGKSSEIIRHFMQLSLDNIEIWAHENGFTFSVSKTKFILFSRMRSITNVNLFLNGCEIEQVNDYKYLGIWFDSKLNWKSHIQYIQKVCFKRINFLRTITGTWWGAHPSDMITLYTTTIRSVMEYGCFTFVSASQTQFSKLEKIQFRCLRICLKLMNSTHTKSIEVLAGIAPLKIRFHDLNCKFLVQCFSSNHPLIDIMQSLHDINPSSKLLVSFNQCSAQNIVPIPSMGFHNYKIATHSFQPFIDLSLLEELKQIPKPEHAHFAKILFNRKFGGVSLEQFYFTDGSLIRDIAGFGVYTVSLAYFYKLKSPCSVFIAELVALYYACRLIKNCSPNLYVICSDSMSSLRALNSSNLNFKTHHFILMLKKILTDLYSEGFIIKFVWVPSHCNIYGNEQADILAKLGAIRGIIYDREICPSEYHPIFKKNSLNDWQNSWNESEFGRWCYSICPQVKHSPWFHNISASRNFICLFSRLMSNHYNCSSHLYRINVNDSNLCECGKSYEDIDHIVLQCSRFILPRKNLMDNISKLNHPIPVSVRDILAHRYLPILKLVYNFLKNISYCV